MDCREFEAAWNERLDATSGAAASWPASDTLESHAASCAACYILAAKYHVLGQALSLRSRTVHATPEGFADRVLAAFDQQRSSHRLSLGGWPVRLALAATLLLAVGLGLRYRASDQGSQRAHVQDVPATSSAEAGDLSEALAQATSATIDLARETSAPAARVGREVLVSAEEAETAGGLSFSDPVPSVAEAFNGVGERMNAGVKPLGGSARRAFSFLFDAATDAEKPTPPGA